MKNRNWNNIIYSQLIEIKTHGQNNLISSVKLLIYIYIYIPHNKLSQVCENLHITKLIDFCMVIRDYKSFPKHTILKKRKKRKKRKDYWFCD